MATKKTTKIDWVELIIELLVTYAISLGCVTIGWNMLLPKLFMFIPVLSLKKLCILTLAIDLLSTPATIGGSMTRGKILKAARGEE